MKLDPPRHDGGVHSGLKPMSNKGKRSVTVLFEVKPKNVPLIDCKYMSFLICFLCKNTIYGLQKDSQASFPN